MTDCQAVSHCMLLLPTPAAAHTRCGPHLLLLTLVPTPARFQEDRKKYNCIQRAQQVSQMGADHAHTHSSEQH